MTSATRLRIAATHRWEGLDALRGIAAVLVVMLHAAMPYLHRPMPGLVWAAQDVPSPVVDALCWAIEGFIMPLFFLQAGFFAAGLHNRLGEKEFLKHRARRLLVPMAFACVVILPADLYIWAAGFLCDGRCTWTQFRRLNFDRALRADLFGFSHLWFLEYLFLLCVGLAAAGLFRRRFPRMRLPANGLVRFAAGCAVVAGVLVIEPGVVVGFQHAFLPVLPKFLHSAAFFSLGIWLHGGETRRERIVAWSPAMLVAALVVFSISLPKIHQHQEAPLLAESRVGLGLLLAFYAVTMSLGLFGLFLGWVRRTPPTLKRLADASFWIYLVHHPLVGLIQIDLIRSSLAPEWKFLAVTGLTLLLTIASYEAFVRNGWLGVLLNGSRGTTAPATLPARVPAIEPAVENRAAA